MGGRHSGMVDTTQPANNQHTWPCKAGGVVRYHQHAGHTVQKKLKPAGVQHPRSDAIATSGPMFTMYTQCSIGTPCLLIGPIINHAAWGKSDPGAAAVNKKALTGVVGQPANTEPQYEQYAAEGPPWTVSVSSGHNKQYCDYRPKLGLSPVHWSSYMFKLAGSRF